ncbi:13457_t:CDS:1, partial [Acaulospora morrowiae]
MPAEKLSTDETPSSNSSGILDPGELHQSTPALVGRLLCQR